MEYVLKMWTTGLESAQPNLSSAERFHYTSELSDYTRTYFLCRIESNKFLNILPGLYLYIPAGIGRPHNLKSTDVSYLHIRKLSYVNKDGVTGGACAVYNNIISVKRRRTRVPLPPSKNKKKFTSSGVFYRNVYSKYVTFF